MSRNPDTSDGLIKECSDAVRNGFSFPDIWERILKKHRLVAGAPVQTFEDEFVHLDVRLNNGYWLRYHAASNDFSLRRPLHRAF